MPLETPAAPMAEDAFASEIPIGEAPAEEFELDEGLIFDDDDVPVENILPESTEPPASHSPTPEIAEATHGESLSSADSERGPIKFGETMPDDPHFDALLEDANLLSNAPESGNSRNASPHHPGHEPAGAEHDKDAELLEFNAFLRQLDEEHGHRTSRDSDFGTETSVANVEPAKGNLHRSGLNRHGTRHPEVLRRIYVRHRNGKILRSTSG